MKFDHRPFFVIPAKAGIHGHDVAEGIAQPLTTPQPWIPASAGMTKVGGAAPRVAPRVFSASPRLRANQTLFASSRLRANAHNPRQKARHV
ncbi:hypothetical protein [uncultured Sphingomonas sp.]|uniref:hypothetical protein n=1 Tax=uncultured Sphingomonas sp. TaxID=158754 RepID=UPI0025FB8221|nr:hypothetical protein [uncultured Sphingomonas sp.]